MKKWFSWSKGVLFLTSLIFVFVLAFVSYMYMSNQISNVTDVAALVAMITVSGSIFGANITWYSKKAAAENQFKLRSASYKEAANIRLEYNKEMMKLMKEFEMDEDMVQKIEDKSDMDEIMDNAFGRVNSNLDSNEEEFSNVDEIQQI